MKNRLIINDSNWTLCITLMLLKTIVLIIVLYTIFIDNAIGGICTGLYYLINGNTEDVFLRSNLMLGDRLFGILIFCIAYWVIGTRFYTKSINKKAFIIAAVCELSVSAVAGLNAGILYLLSLLNNFRTAEYGIYVLLGILSKQNPFALSIPLGSYGDSVITHYIVYILLSPMSVILVFIFNKLSQSIKKNRT